MSSASKILTPPSQRVSVFEPKLSIPIYTLIFFLCSLLQTGYAVYVQNQALQIPLVHFLNNPSLYPNDPFGATLPYYSSTLWYGVALLHRFIPLEPLLLTLFLFERFLVIYAAGRLAQAFAPQSKLAVVGAMALIALAISPIIGSGTVVEDYFEQTGFSIPFFLLGIASFYKERPLPCAIWLAIGFNLNSMYGVYALTYLGAVFLLDSTYQRDWKKWTLFFGLFLLLASPVIYLTAVAFGREAVDKQLWLAASKFRFPHHLYPLAWGKENFARFSILIGLLISILYQNRQRVGKLFKYSAIWAGVSGLWVLYAFVAAYIAKSPSMIVMHPGRATDLWYCLAGIALTSGCAVQLEASRGKARWLLAALVFGSSILIWHQVVGTYIIAVCLMAFTFRPVWYYILGRGSTNRVALLLTLVVFLMGVKSFRYRISQTGSFDAALIRRPSSSIEEVVNWASANTPLDAQFLVELVSDPGLPGWEEFRGLAKRPVFVTWKDGSGILWDRPYVQAWAERLNALGFDVTKEESENSKNKLKTLYEELRDEDIKRLQSRFIINYWIVPVNHPSTFPVAFQNLSYKVLKLQ
ncbi:DUF6798 domain-containing protein [Coleofasciculus sp. FACHB-1120]|uniref:DUF6798 domain-containing protein n=1 Tax=Coleofasciculus sp. FACHB-1120 TaxID=2692783 RepID=UPI0016883A44|nr:DUF6798 domain-containing protein [Coleofasciculus sp. FACHB-1120]MBD2742010.1 hypothetical protein [Coleofasciculus sp. FACHB-1120]